MRRLLDIPLEYLIAGLLAVALGVGIYALRGSNSSATTPPVASAPAPATHPAASSPGQPGNPLSAALIARSRRAYEHVRAVTVHAHVANASLTFTMILRHGKVVAESFIGERPGRVSELVAPNGPATYGRAAANACWGVVPASAPQTLTDVGHSFPDFDTNTTLLAPQPVAGGWAVNAEHKGQLEAYILDGRTHLVRALSGQQGGIQVTMHVRNLASVPRLPAPEPRCP